MDVKRPWDYLALAAELGPALANIHLEIAGSGTEEARLRAAALALENGPAFLGALTRQEVLQRMGTAHVFVSMSGREAFGLAMAEAMTHGCAVVAADAGPALDLLGQNGGVVRAPVGAARRIAETLCTWSSDDSARLRHASAGWRYACAAFSESAMLDTYDRVLRRVVRAARASRRWQAPQLGDCDLAITD